MDSSIKYKRTLKQGGKMKPTRPREKDLPLTDKEKMLLIMIIHLMIILILLNLKIIL